MRTSRSLSLALLVLVGLLLTAARCVENTSLRRDAAGNWRIYGEIHNETEIQGAEIIVVGTLLDANGNAIATAQTPICPFELSPGSFSVYDIEFQNSSAIPQPASYKVNVLSGKALPSALPQLDLTMSGLKAKRVGDTVTITGTVRANAHYPGDYSGCAAFYDASGKVVQELTILGFGQLEENVSQPLELPLPLVPPDAQSVRFWVVGPGSEPLASDYRAVMSNPIAIP